MKPALLAAFLVTALLLSSCAAADPAKNTGRPAEIAEAGTDETERVAEEEEMSRYDFTEFPNITITGIDISSLNETELAILYAQARYCQAMTDADIDTMRELVAEDMIYTHMSGMQQTRENTSRISRMGACAISRSASPIRSFRQTAKKEASPIRPY